MTRETRAALIGLAKDAFGRQGFAGVVLEELTAAAGLTRGALYHHFEGKLGLFGAVVDEIDDMLDTAVEGAAHAAGGGWPGFRAGCRAFLQAMLAPDVQRIMLRDAPAVISGFADRPRMQLCTRQMVTSLADLMDNGVIRKTDPEALARIVSGAVNDAASWAATRPDPGSALAAAGDAFDKLLDGLEVRRD